MKKVSLSRNDLLGFAADDLGFYGLDLTRISTVFIAQIFQLQVNRTIDTMSLMDEVKYLEGLRNRTSTEKEKAFKKLPLKGLFKKHFMSAGFIVKNIGAHFGFEWGGNINLDNLIEEVFSNNKSGYVDDAFVGQLTHGMVTQAIEKRAEKGLTGEWIVFRKFKGKNYYLTIAAHNEGDENIFNRLCDAYDFDFPFLRN